MLGLLAPGGDQITSSPQALPVAGDEFAPQQQLAPRAAPSAAAAAAASFPSLQVPQKGRPPSARAAGAARERSDAGAARERSDAGGLEGEVRAGSGAGPAGAAGAARKRSAGAAGAALPESRAPRPFYVAVRAPPLYKIHRYLFSLTFSQTCPALARF